MSTFIILSLKVATWRSGEFVQGQIASKRQVYLARSTWYKHVLLTAYSIFVALSYLKMHWWSPNHHLQARKGKWPTSQFSGMSPHVHMAILPSLYLSTGGQSTSEYQEENKEERWENQRMAAITIWSEANTGTEIGRSLLNSGSEGQGDRDGGQGFVLGSLSSVRLGQTVKGSRLVDQSTKTWWESFSLSKTLSWIGTWTMERLRSIADWSIPWGCRNKFRSSQKATMGRESNILQKY